MDQLSSPTPNWENHLFMDLALSYRGKGKGVSKLGAHFCPKNTSLFSVFQPLQTIKKMYITLKERDNPQKPNSPPPLFKVNPKASN